MASTDAAPRGSAAVPPGGRESGAEDDVEGGPTDTSRGAAGPFHGSRGSPGSGDGLGRDDNFEDAL